MLICCSYVQITEILHKLSIIITFAGVLDDCNLEGGDFIFIGDEMWTEMRSDYSSVWRMLV